MKCKNCSAEISSEEKSVPTSVPQEITIWRQACMLALHANKAKYILPHKNRKREIAR